MKNTLFMLFALIVAVAWAEPLAYNTSEHIQQAIGADLSLKTLMVEDGSPKGKCYCSCSLNNQPVFMEIDPDTMSGTDMMMGL